jgi:predicted amidohydrolase YtcJ
MFNWDTALLGRHFEKVMERGIQIHVHATGDGATRNTLDAMEYAGANNPGVNTRNTITHMHLVNNADKLRMGAMGVIGSTQPFWHMKEPDWYDYMEVPFLGADRAYSGYPVKSLIDAGVTVTFSGDYNVTDPNEPFWAIETAVTRNLNSADFYEVPDIYSIDDPTYLRNPAERISVKQAVEAYTINGAYQLFMEDQTGSLAVGKWADMILIDQDIVSFTGNQLLDIDQTQILATYFAGKLVSGENNNDNTRVETLQRLAPSILKNGLTAENLILSGKELSLVLGDMTIVLATNANNRNISGSVALGDGYYLNFDIKGNGSNIKVFEIVKK